MIIYGIATKVGHCGGKDDNYDSWDIRTEGGWGSGDYPPFFTSRLDAAEYIRDLPYHSDKRIVQINLISKEII